MALDAYSGVKGCSLKAPLLCVDRLDLFRVVWKQQYHPSLLVDIHDIDDAMQALDHQTGPFNVVCQHR
jgi:hypothetical protein